MSGYYALSLNSRVGMIAAGVNGTNWLYLGIYDCGGAIAYMNGSSTQPVLSAMQASAIDQKIDDGMPTTGNIYATMGTSGLLDGNPNNANSGSSLSLGYYNIQCETTATPPAYNVTVNGSGLGCNLLVKLQ